MSVVGPGSSRNTRLIFSMLFLKLFCLSFNKTICFSKKFQTLFIELATKLNIEFVPCLDFGMIKKLEGCPLVVEDSSEEIHHEKEFVKLDVTGKHKKCSIRFDKR